MAPRDEKEAAEEQASRVIERILSLVPRLAVEPPKDSTWRDSGGPVDLHRLY
jgi:hypothetical protein